MSTAGHKAAKGAKEQRAKERSSFQWDDPLLFDDQLTEDERLIRDTARGYAQDKLMPRVIEAYMQENTDRAIFAEMGALGLLGVVIPEAYGGAAANYVSYGLVAREIERVDSGLSLVGVLLGRRRRGRENRRPQQAQEQRHFKSRRWRTSTIKAHQTNSRRPR
jgi:alkylation response protein AidB-like acyl-CoA dehydrogenase